MLLRWIRLLFRTLPILLCDALRLACLVVALSPGFVRFSWYYWVLSRRTSVRYGRESCRQTLDVYRLDGDGDRIGPRIEDTGGSGGDVRDIDCTDSARDELLGGRRDAGVGGPAGGGTGAPVVVFFTGGAWMIGYKMWGALLARALTAAGVVVVIPDHRNYPSAPVPGMVRDVERALSWVVDHVADFGGDPDKIVLVGQSAGGHLLCTALLRRAMDLLSAPVYQSSNDDEFVQPTWRPTDFRGFISLSAPYDLKAMQATFSRHGLDAHLVERVFGGEQEAFSPLDIVRTCQRDGKSLNGLIPPIQIYHGSLDTTVPNEGSEVFAAEIRKILDERESVAFCSYIGWSHTDAILEGPMEADHRFHRDLLEAVRGWTDSPLLVWPENDWVVKGLLCPRLLVRVGRQCNPF